MYPGNVVGALGFPIREIAERGTAEVFADAVLLGLPFDGGANSLPGQRHGPELLRFYGPRLPWDLDGDGRLGGLVDPSTNRRILEGRVVHDLGDLGSVPLDPRLSRVAYYDAVARVARQLASAGALPIFIGGDHSLTAAIMDGFSRVWDQFSLVVVDAHCDFNASRSGRLGDVTHADFLAFTSELPAIARTDVCGVRTPLPTSALPLHPSLSVSSPLPVWEQTTDLPTYLSIDLDVLDPAFFPGTGHPEPGGWRVEELFGFISAVAATNQIIGIDLVEATYDEQCNRTTGTAMAAVLLHCLRAVFDKEGAM